MAATSTRHIEVLLPILVLADSDNVGGVTSVSATETAQFVESATIGGITAPSAAETSQFVDSSTPATVTNISGLEEHDIYDSGTVAGVTSLSDTDVYAAVDSATVGNKTTPSTSDVAAFVESAIINGVTTPSATIEKEASKDSATVYGTSRALETNYHDDFGDPAYTFKRLSSPVDPAVIVDNQLVMTALIAGNTYSEIHYGRSEPPNNYFNTQSIEGITVVIKLDSFVGSLDHNSYIFFGAWQAPWLNLRYYGDGSLWWYTRDFDGTFATGQFATGLTPPLWFKFTVVSGVRSVYYSTDGTSWILVKSFTPGANVSTTVNNYGSLGSFYWEVDALTADTTVVIDFIDVSWANVSQEIAQFADADTINGITTPSSLEEHDTYDSSTCAGTTNVVSADIAAFIESGTVSGTTVVSASEVADYTDSDKPTSITSLSSQDLLSGIDSSTVGGVTTPTTTDTAAFVDGSEVDGITTISATEVYTSGSGGVEYDDSSTVGSKTSLSAAEISEISDTGTPNSTTTSSSADIVAYVDQSIVDGVTYIISSDVLAVGDASLISSKTTISPFEVYVGLDSATLTSITSIIYTERKEAGDFGIIVSRSSVISTDTAQYVEIGTVTSRTTLIEIKEVEFIVELVGAGIKHFAYECGNHYQAQATERFTYVAS